MRKAIRAAWVLSAALAVAAALPAQQAPADAFTGGLHVVLHEALFRKATPQEGRAHLVLSLEADAGKWHRVWGQALGYNNGVHTGVVREAAVTRDAIRLKVLVLTDGDMWVPGGHVGVYAIDLKRGEAGTLAGTYEGSFKGAAISGTATGKLAPPRPIRIKGFQDLDPQAHPRVLFRRSDLPALRDKLKTPFGQAYFELAAKSWDPISLGVLYQLTGEKKFAEAAEKIIREYKEDFFVGSGGSGGTGHKLVSVALAYDLCYDAWGADLRDDLRRRILKGIDSLQLFLEGPANYHPCSNYYGPGRGSAAIASLALWGEKGPEPAKPPDPVSEAKAIKPVAGYTPGKGVPVVDFQPGQPPRQWLCGGPIDIQASGAFFLTLAEYAVSGAHEGAGKTLASFAGGKPRAITLTFRKLPAECVTDAGVALDKLADPAKCSTTVLFAVLKVAADEVVGLCRGQAATKVFLSGAELDDESYYRLTPGLYPMLVVHAAAKSTGTIAPRLSAPASADLALRRAAYDVRLALWQADHDDWKRLGGADPGLIRRFHVGHRQVWRHYRLGIGDGGFHAETGSYSLIGGWYPLVYATAYLKVFGRNASAWPDVTHLMPRRMMQVLFCTDGKPMVQKVNSVVGFDPNWVAAALPIVPDEWKPAMLWGWNYARGVTGEADRAKILGSRGAFTGGLTLAQAFCHYPLEMKPVHPGKIMPLTWQAPTFGLDVFRSGWQGSDEFIAQVFAKASLIAGWNHGNAATFRVLGLGHGWVTGSVGRVGFRIQEPVVMLPTNETQERACGRLAYRKVQPDGSGIVTIDLNDVYSAPSEKKHAELYDGNLIRHPENLVESGITGLRAFAFDYSGAAGTPCLAVIVDKIVGGRRRFWQWQLSAEMLSQVKIDGRTFTIDQGDATMKATFVTPEDPELAARNEMVRVGKLGDKHRSFEGNLSRVIAAGKDHFFVVLTFQRGAPPPVRIEGHGLAAKVTVGRQTVRFEDGPPARIVLQPLK